MFKTCINCEQKWETPDEFLCDQEVRFIGYQAQFDHAKAGLFLFNHVCKSTLAIELNTFEAFSPVPLSMVNFKPRTERCPGHCADNRNIEPCSNTDCAGKPIRDLIQIIKQKNKA